MTYYSREYLLKYFNRQALRSFFESGELIEDMAPACGQRFFKVNRDTATAQLLQFDLKECEVDNCFRKGVESV